MGTKFTVYDSGLNPVKTTSSLEAGNLRQELAAICYVSQDPPQKRTFRDERRVCVDVCVHGIWEGRWVAVTEDAE